ncbi:hypothetical protein [Streptomyces zingiberis]|uniref:hypothetical protein n=1 Tax=Streptomyces zingiberis TaxID=2053010 RepID=UPI0019CF720D|nr:hypothetical protein [Streptomyces zingiberis]
MRALIETAALLSAVLGVPAALIVYARVREVGTALGVLLDFLAAAGLIRLSAAMSWSSILGAAAVITVRKVAAYGVTLTERGHRAPDVPDARHATDDPDATAATAAPDPADAPGAPGAAGNG